MGHRSDKDVLRARNGLTSSVVQILNAVVILSLSFSLFVRVVPGHSSVHQFACKLLEYGAGLPLLTCIRSPQSPSVSYADSITLATSKVSHPHQHLHQNTSGHAECAEQTFSSTSTLSSSQSIPQPMSSLSLLFKQSARPGRSI